MVDVQCLSDHDLHGRLKRLGFSSGPILPSTRKVYEKKLAQLLVSPPCDPPAMNRYRKSDEYEDSDENEDLNIILKGNITLSTEKEKEFKKSPVFDTQRQQEDFVKPNSGCKNLTALIKAAPYLTYWLFRGLFLDDINWRFHVTNLSSTQSRICERFQPSTSERSLNICCLGQKPNKIRCAARSPNPRTTNGCVTEEDYCQGPESGLPWGLKLAIFGIFIIVMFVYITVEKKPPF